MASRRRLQLRPRLLREVPDRVLSRASRRGVTHGRTMPWMVHPIAALTQALLLVRVLVAGGLLMAAAVFMRRH